MQLHANAAVSLIKRRQVVERVLEQGWSIAEAARAAEISSKTCGKWVSRYRADRECGLLDRSSAPKAVANRTCERRDCSDRGAATVAVHRPGDRRDAAHAALDGVGHLDADWDGSPGPARLRAGGALRARPTGRADSHRRQEAGADRAAGTLSARRPAGTRTGRLSPPARSLGWEFVRVAIDDCTRLAYVEVLDDERPATAIAFLRRAIAFYRRYGIHVERLITDNGGAYRSAAHAIACRALGIRPPAHTPLSTANQRQGRALHPHHAQQLGLRRALPRQHRTHRRA